MWLYRKEIHQQWYQYKKIIYFGKNALFKSFFTKWSSDLCCVFWKYMQGICLACIPLITPLERFPSPHTYMHEQGRNHGENLVATSAMVGRICRPPPKKNLGATRVAPVAPVDTFLMRIKNFEIKENFGKKLVSFKQLLNTLLSTASRR